MIESYVLSSVPSSMWVMIQTVENTVHQGQHFETYFEFPPKNAFGFLVVILEVD